MEERFKTIADLLMLAGVQSTPMVLELIENVTKEFDDKGDKVTLKDIRDLKTMVEDKYTKKEKAAK
ncbi:hypothetical protein M1M30_gp061 [Maribacter phage Colly_1]|uniref:Uncharacterized protein n=1 Tax=Maribacter phage Colly_1 TaxID=2745691 RepID=A0A8E4UY04_9CAUD|nr:hypothetical protein M1M30_gp061 [Maribacter phage Colly_1]QQO97346.1 hypothetical protein Colly1_61 [Maribacter phage Colly_1]